MSDTSYESIIGSDVLGGDAVLAEARLTCKSCASQLCFCGCGSIHDQKKIHVVEMREGGKCLKMLWAICPTCYRKADKRLAVAKKCLADIREKTKRDVTLAVATWAGYQEV